MRSSRQRYSILLLVILFCNLVSCHVKRVGVVRDYKEDSTGKLSHSRIEKYRDTLQRFSSVVSHIGNEKVDSSITRVYTFSKPVTMRDIESKSALVSSVTTIENRIKEVSKRQDIKNDTQHRLVSFDVIDTVHQESVVKKVEKIKKKSIKKPSYLWIFWVSLSLVISVFLVLRLKRFF